MKLRQRRWPLLLVALLAVGPTLAADTQSTNPPAKDTAATRTATPQAAPAPTAASPAPADAAAGKSEDKAPAPSSSKPSPQHFEPSEKVRPDFDVSFPVDI